jgi:DNA-binding protein H-NS
MANQEELEATEAPPLDAQALRASVLRQARWLVDFYRIAPDELLASAPQSALVPQQSPAPLPIKYRHPVTGESWDGVGAHPQWMRQALLQDGYRVEELRVTPNAEDHHARTAA